MYVFMSCKKVKFVRLALKLNFIKFIHNYHNEIEPFSFFLDNVYEHTLYTFLLRQWQ